MKAFEALRQLAAYADTDLLLCRKGERLVYRTEASPDGVRASLAPFKDLLLSLLPPGECQGVRELFNPRNLAVFLWTVGSRGGRQGTVVLTWVVNGVYRRSTLEDGVAEFVWRLPRQVVRVHLVGSSGLSVDVERVNVPDLWGVHALARRGEYLILAGSSRVHAFVNALKAAVCFSELGVWPIVNPGEREA